MDRRDELIYREAVALYQEVFGEPPPPSVEGVVILEMVTRNLPTTTYRRLRSPFLRPSTITGPRSSEETDSPY